MNPPNPKQSYGDLKPNLSLNPGVASTYQALAHEHGAKKYGAFNWRESGVEAMTYVAAAKRHLDDWVDGEEISSDTVDTDRPVHNLGGVMASVAILIDAMHCGKMIDNRPSPGGSSELHDHIQSMRKSHTYETDKPLDGFSAEHVKAVADRYPPACPDHDDLWCNPPEWEPTSPIKVSWADPVDAD